jgi:hypothetical protein
VCGGGGGGGWGGRGDAGRCQPPAAALRLNGRAVQPGRGPGCRRPASTACRRACGRPPCRRPRAGRPALAGAARARRASRSRSARCWPAAPRPPRLQRAARCVRDRRPRQPGQPRRRLHLVAAKLAPSSPPKCVTATSSASSSSSAAGSGGESLGSFGCACAFAFAFAVDSGLMAGAARERGEKTRASAWAERAAAGQRWGASSRAPWPYSSSADGDRQLMTQPIRRGARLLLLQPYSTISSCTERHAAWRDCYLISTQKSTCLENRHTVDPACGLGVWDACGAWRHVLVH